MHECQSEALSRDFTETFNRWSKGINKAISQRTTIELNIEEIYKTK